MVLHDRLSWQRLSGTDDSRNWTKPCIALDGLAPSESCAVTASNASLLNGRRGVVTVIPLTNPLASAGVKRHQFARFVIPAEISYK